MTTSSLDPTPGYRPAPRGRSLRVALLLLALAAPLGATGAPEPFYERLLDDGIAAYAGSDLPRAEKYLRLANFGFLESPETLAKGLVYLGLVYAAAGDRESFEHTLGRLLEVEGRFQAYSRAPLPAEVRSALLEHVGRWSDYATLRRYPAFAGIARELGARELAELPAEVRRLTLRQRMLDEPEATRWPLALARLELGAGDPEAGLAALAPVLARSPGLAEAVCLRGQAAALAGRCGSVAADLAACQTLEGEAPLHLAILSCYVAEGRFQRAQAHLAGLPGEVRRKVPARLSREIRKGRRTAGGGEGEAATEPAATEPTALEPANTEPANTGSANMEPEAAAVTASSESADASPAPESPPPPRPLPPSLSAADAAELERIAEDARGARHASELDGPIEEARRIADANPGVRRPQHMVGEFAYRAKKWPLAVEYLERGGSDPARPDISFYLAIALEETGRREEAAAALETCLPYLEKTEFVDQYVRRILGRGL